MSKAKFTRQHYIAIANVISDFSKGGYDLQLVARFADYFGDDNPSFDYLRFYKACNVPDEVVTAALKRNILGHD